MCEDDGWGGGILSYLPFWWGDYVRGDFYLEGIVSGGGDFVLHSCPVPCLSYDLYLSKW